MEWDSQIMIKPLKIQIKINCNILHVVLIDTYLFIYVFSSLFRKFNHICEQTRFKNWGCVLDGDVTALDFIIFFLINVLGDLQYATSVIFGGRRLSRLAL